jgi:hypothetical protein
VRHHPTALVLLVDPQTTRRAIAWVIGHLGPGQKPLIWAPDERSLRYDAELEAFARYATVRTPRSGAAWHGGPVLALWPRIGDLDELARDRRATSICVLGHRAHQKEDIAWLAATGGTVLTVEGVLPAPSRDLHPVVAEALRTLTNLVDLPNHLIGSRDRRHAVVTLTTLRHGGYRLDADPIRTWALANDWTPAGAKLLGDLAAKVQAGVALRARGFDSYPRPELLRLWRDGAIAATG